jgi:hypothetical protein
MKTHHFLNALLVSASALAALGQNQSVSNVAVSDDNFG